MSSVPANILMTFRVFSGSYDLPMTRRTASSDGSGIATRGVWCAGLAMILSLPFAAETSTATNVVQQDLLEQFVSANANTTGTLSPIAPFGSTVACFGTG